jgi:transcriptional regulator with XRE-family HTH domain
MRTDEAEAGCAAQIGPNAGRHRLGAELRRLRKAQSLRLEDAADKLGIAASTLSRTETGKTSIKPLYLAALLDLYGVDDPASCKAARRRGELSRPEHLLPGPVRGPTAWRYWRKSPDLR